MKLFTLAAICALGASTLAAHAGPQANLVPKFNATIGKVAVKNIGNATAGRSFVTISCATSVPGGCPDPAPALAAPYENAAFPNKATVKMGKIAPGSQQAHTIAFFGSLVFAPGTYWFTVCADAGDHVVESNEGDNCRRFRKTVRGHAPVDHLTSR